MIAFQPINTARFSFLLQELTLGAIRYIYELNPDYLEKQRSAFLKACLKELKWHKGYESNTIEDLTVQERLFIEASYLAMVSEKPDFEIANGVYTDYVDVTKQFSPKFLEVELGNLPDDEDVWFIKPLTGKELELIEERVLVKDNPERIDWILHAMAVQLFRKNETIPDIKADPIAYGDWVDERVAKLNNMPESAVIDLIIKFFEGQRKLTHFFKINFDDEGIHILPSDEAEQKEREVALLPARFRPSAKIYAVTQELLGQPKKVNQ